MGFSCANVCTEDHAALNWCSEGSLFTEELRPETSGIQTWIWVKKIYTDGKALYLGIDGSVFYTYSPTESFRITRRPTPNQDHLGNLDGSAYLGKVFFEIWNFGLGKMVWPWLGGATLMDVSLEEMGFRTQANS